MGATSGAGTVYYSEASNFLVFSFYMILIPCSDVHCDSL